MPPQVTICLPVYRRGRKLRRTLNSIRNQTFQDYVVDIAIEPAEDDEETLQCCEEFARDDERFVITQNVERLGWGRNIDAILKRIETPYFMVLPHDDALHFECVEHLWNKMAGLEEVSIVFPDIYFFDAVTGLQVCKERLEENRDERLCEYLLDGGAPEFWKGLTRTEALRSECFGSSVDDDFAAEYEWALKVLSRGKAVRESKALYYKRTHTSDSESVSADWVFRMEDDERYQKLKRHLGRILDQLKGLESGYATLVAAKLAWTNQVLELNLDLKPLNEDAGAMLNTSEREISKLPDSLRQKSSALFHFLRGRDFLIRNHFEEAEFHFRESLSCDPESGRCSVYLIKSLLRQERDEEALSLFLEHSNRSDSPEWRSQELIVWFQNVLTYKQV